MARPLVLAHRGASHRAPENTIAAFALAVELGADGVELDVRRTADDVLVVHHDPDHPAVGPLVARDFADLRAAAPEVPTLEEALDVLEGHVVNIEVKCSSWEPDADPDGRVGRAVAAIVAERGIADSVIVSSFDLPAIDALLEVGQGVPTAWLTAGLAVTEAVAVLEGRGHRYLHPDRVAALNSGPAGIAACRAAGLGVNVWTVNDPVEMRALAAAGVDGIVTDVPDVALAALGSR